MSSDEIVMVDMLRKLENLLEIAVSWQMTLLASSFMFFHTIFLENLY